MVGLDGCLARIVEVHGNMKENYTTLNLVLNLSPLFSSNLVFHFCLPEKIGGTLAVGFD